MLGNEKGGTGKSTVAMHLIVGLLRQDYRVAAIDLDAGQGTLTRFFDNRRVYAVQQGLQLPQPLYRTVGRSDLRDLDEAAEEERERLGRAIDALSHCDCIVLDLPGSDNHLSRAGHFFADTLITPLNDSFVDLDMLARIDPDTLEFQSLGQYAEMVWEQQKRRIDHGRGAIDWIIMRNRLASLASRNRRDIDFALANITRKLGVPLVAGFGERVIFRELFAKGLTLFDLRDLGPGAILTMSHVAALQEVRNLMQVVVANWTEIDQNQRVAPELVS